MGIEEATTTMKGELSLNCVCGHVVASFKAQGDEKLDVEVDGELIIECPKCGKQTTVVGIKGAGALTIVK